MQGGVVRRDEAPRDLSGLLQQVGIRRQPAWRTSNPTRLAGADQVAHSALLQIQLGNPEPVARTLRRP
jgi:hypothetical protein